MLTRTRPRNESEKTMTIRIGLLLLAGSLLVIGGCTDITPETTRMDMSPEMETLGKTQQERQNMQFRAIDETLRQINDDTDSLLFLDRPVGLSRYPIVRR